MKLHYIFICLVAVMVTSQVSCGRSSIAFETDTNGGVIAGSSTLDGTEYRIALRTGDFANQPKWNPAESEVPLTAHEACLLAEKEVTKATGLDGWTVSTIKLDRNQYDSNVWYYSLEFSHRRGLLIVVVLLDGTVIMPKPAKD